MSALADIYRMVKNGDLKGAVEHVIGLMYPNSYPTAQEKKQIEDDLRKLKEV